MIVADPEVTPEEDTEEITGAVVSGVLVAPDAALVVKVYELEVAEFPEESAETTW